MSSIQDEIVSQKQLVIVEKYEAVVNYLYPVFFNLRKQHAVLREKAQACLFDQVSLFIEAGKSNQVSKLHLADANLAMLRWYLRFMVDDARKLITLHQHQVAGILIAETGNLLGAWIRSRK